jgi:hypothetical protein
MVDIISQATLAAPKGFGVQVPDGAVHCMQPLAAPPQLAGLVSQQTWSVQKKPPAHTRQPFSLQSLPAMSSQYAPCGRLARQSPLGAQK